MNGLTSTNQGVPAWWFTNNKFDDLFDDFLRPMPDIELKCQVDHYLVKNETPELGYREFNPAVKEELVGQYK